MLRLHRRNTTSCSRESAGFHTQILDREPNAEIVRRSAPRGSARIAFAVQRLKVARRRGRLGPRVKPASA